MLTNHTLFLRKFEGYVTAETERLKEALTNIHAAEGFDFAAYKHHVGIIKGLRQALELAEEAEAVVNGKEEGA